MMQKRKLLPKAAGEFGGVELPLAISVTGSGPVAAGSDGAWRGNWGGAGTQRLLLSTEAV